jgi:outer membrane murein-binding lipoprotein Lpp
MKRVLVVAALTVSVGVLPAGAAPPAKQQIAQLKRQVATLRAKVASLQQQARALEAASAQSWRRELALRRYAAASGACPVTRPNGSLPPGSTFGSEFDGNGSLWVGVPQSNVVVGEPDASGAVSDKFGWWRAVSGTLSITGQRLDGAAPPLTASVPDGYGDSGFQSSGITFPSAGCWEVTGRAGGASLTFVTLVLAS